MAFKDTLKTFQPVVYQTLQHALSSKKLAHAYLFQGPAGTPKKETAYLLAQSLLCPHADPFGCETCDICRRAANGQYADMIVLDGTAVSIKKEQVLNLQDTFSKTGLESAGHKIYVIDRVENATVDALNSLLKFLEEPTSDMTAILISEQIDRVLPTIVSRCQVVSFKPMDQKYSLKLCRDQGMDDLDAYLLSQMVHSPEEIQTTLDSNLYQHARFCMKEVIPLFRKDAYRALLFLQTEAFPGKNKAADKSSLQYLLDMLVIYYKDCLKQNPDCSDAWYVQQLQEGRQDADIICQVLNVLMDTKDTLIRTSVNIALLIDQLVYRIKEVS